MNEEIISLSNVWKRFKKGRKLLLKEALLDMFRPERTTSFWALKDVSFTINKGEAVGIIGKNGSGKSTILKLIAGVMVPTKGKVVVKGRIAPLIELGAGFHPELSGRENVYLNGTILGLRRSEIDGLFKKIVDFSELEEFIDTPVKHYSSGMFMRLAFAIAVHTSPDILLIDEILAVGDEEFQKKCLRKMKDFKKKGVTILFVSHSLEDVEDFCDKAIYIKDGEIAAYDSSENAITLYKKEEKLSKQ